MEQAKPLQLVSPDLLLETVNTMTASEIDVILSGIAMVSDIEETVNQPVDETKVEMPFGDQLMAEVCEEIRDGNVETITEPPPTFSANGKGNQIADDGGTGPGRDE